MRVIYFKKKKSTKEILIFENNMPKYQLHNRFNLYGIIYRMTRCVSYLVTH